MRNRGEVFASQFLHVGTGRPLSELIMSTTVNSLEDLSCYI